MSLTRTPRMSATPSLRYGATCVGPPAGFAVKLTSRCALRSDNHGESDDEASLSFGRLATRSEEHTSELQSQSNLVCRLLLEKNKRYRSPRTCPQSGTGQ